MPISYNYEGPLSQKAYNTAVKAGYQQQLEDTRRFQAQQALQYNQMAMQAAMEQQRMQNQRWMQMADQYGSQQNIQAQGAINQGLQQSSQQFQERMAGLGNQYDTQQMQKQFELREKYNQAVLSQEMNAVGEAKKQAFQQRLDALDKARRDGIVSDTQLPELRNRIYSEAMEIPWESFQKAAGKDPGTWGTTPWGDHTYVGQDGNVQVFEGSADAQTQAKQKIFYVDPNTNLPVAPGTPGAKPMILQGSRVASLEQVMNESDMEVAANKAKMQLEAAKMEQDQRDSMMKHAMEILKASETTDENGNKSYSISPQQAAQQAAQLWQAFGFDGTGPVPQGPQETRVDQHMDWLDSQLGGVQGYPQEPTPRGAGAPGVSRMNPQPITSPEQVSKLPRGTWVRTPDGRVGQVR